MLPAGFLVGLIKIQTSPLYINLHIFLPPKEYFFSIYSFTLIFIILYLFLLNN